MPITVDMNLIDAVSAPAAGGGTWQVSVRNKATILQDTGPVNYSSATLNVTLNVGGPWTHLKIVVTPTLYAPAAIELNPSPSGNYRDDTLTTVKVLHQGAVNIDLPLLRVREAVGVVPPSPPRPGSNLAGPWLTTPSGRATPVYRECLVTPWLAKRSNVTTLFDSNPTKGPFASPDDDGWDRFNSRGVRVIDPPTQGAAMLLEYGEVGTNSSSGPRFLVGLWAPTRLSTTAMPTWRDIVTFIHPSTAKIWYPQAAYPFRAPYPYAVGDNPNVPSSDPDRTWQPYVNLALHYLVGELAPYRLSGNEAIMISPVFPNPVGAQSEQQAYGLPFRTTAGLARLIAEVNLFLHRIRYGFSGSNFDHWWGARSIAASYLSFVEVKAPPLRRVAVAAYSAATAQLDALLSGQSLSSGRYAMTMWGVPSAVLDQFGDSWRETWCLDLLADATTVRAATFEQHLKAWVTAKSDRMFFMGGSGTTGHDDPDTHYPMLSKASASNIVVQSPTVANRHGSLWRGSNNKWTAIFCSNAYLSASAADTKHWPAFPVAPLPDDAHGFMFQLTSGFAVHETQIGVP